MSTSKFGRRWWLFGTAAVVFLALFVSASTGTLPGSTFESNDGNLVVDTAGNQDWANAPNRVTKVEANSGALDDSFGQGSKEDISNPTVVTGSIPPNKSDLSRFYVAHESVGGNFFLYLAWERTNVLGSANMDFEFNQSQTIDANGVTPVRTAGDILITFDFVNGGGTPVLGLLRWITSGPASQCFASNKVPCWGNRVDLSAAGFADGAVNSTTVTDPISGQSLPALTFGEAAINLSAAGVIPSGQCVNFATAFLKSRSSAAFTAELKDFIAPANAQIRNCGQIIIRKQTDPDGAPGTFHYSTTGGLNPAAFDLQDNGVQDYGAAVQAGSYSVTEADPGPTFVLASIDCSASSLGHGSTATPSLATGTVSIDLKPEDTVDCTYTNRQQLGAIAIHKTSSKDGSALAGAEFDIRNAGDSSLVAHVTTDAGGNACVDHLVFGNYTVQETSAPGGYAIDDSSSHTVAVGSEATCGSGNEANISFSDTPLSRITVAFESLAPGDPTSATIQCTGDGGAQALPEGSPRVLDNLPPGTYSCTVVVDP